MMSSTQYTKLRIGILSQSKKLYSTKRLVEAARGRGHTVEVVDTTRCYVNIAAHKPSVHYREKSLDKFHAVIPRIAASITFFGTAVVRQFEMMGTYTLNESLAISRSRDKLRCLQILSKHGIGLPVTGFAHSTHMTKDLIQLAGGAPLIVKLLQSSQGKGVVLTPTVSAAESVIDAFRGLNAHFLVQEFIEEAGGSDIRCLVIGDKVVAAMQRKAKQGEFRANIHRGGTAEPVKITPAERAIAVRSARLLGLSVAGVDLLRSNNGPLVLEINSSPGLEGIEKASEKDIADLIIRYIEKNWQQSKAKKKRKQG